MTLTQTAMTPRKATPTAWRVLPADADEATWLRARRGGIGSSDIAAVLGVAERRTALHVWHDKRGELPDDDAGEAALWGKLHEETVAREWARRNRSTVRRVGLVAHVDHDWMRCTLDRAVGACPLDRTASGVCALEVKTRNAWVAGKWRRDMPDDVLAQCVWQMAVTGYDHIHTACLIGGNDYRQYVTRRDRALELDVVAAAEWFWLENVRAGVRPKVDAFAHGGDLIDLDNRLHPDRAGIIRLPLEKLAWQTVRDYELARLRESRAAREKEAAKAALVAMLEGHEAAYAAQPLGREDEPLWTYAPRRGRPNVDLAGLAERWPDAYADCVSETETRAIAIAHDLRLKEEDLDRDDAS